jgi:hypothetical protein
MPANFFSQNKRATSQGAPVRVRPRTGKNVRNNIMLRYTVQVSPALAGSSLLKRSEGDEVDRGMGQRVARKGSKWWRVLRASRRSNCFASRQRLGAKPQVPLAKRESGSAPKYPEIRRCARELHASRRTKLELQRVPASTRARTHMHTRAYALTHPLAHARTHTAMPRALARTRTRARREQTERVRTSGPICDDAGRTEPGRAPGGLRVSRAAALSERNQQFRKRKRA